MSWTAPYTWSTNEVLTASRMNAQVRDNLDYVHDLPITHSASAGPVTMTNNGTYYVGADGGSYEAGTWLIWFVAECTPTNASDVFTYRIRNTTDNTTIKTMDGASLPGASSNFKCVLALWERVTFASAKSVQGQCTNTSTNGGTLEEGILLGLRVDV